MLISQFKNNTLGLIRKEIDIMVLIQSITMEMSEAEITLSTLLIVIF